MTDLEIIVMALERVANQYGCHGTHDGDLICDALRRLRDDIDYIKTKVDHGEEI